MKQVKSGGARVPPADHQRAARWLSNMPLPEPHLAGAAAAMVLHRLRPWPLPGPRRVHRLAGAVLLAAGGCLVLWSVRAARQVNLASPGQLVTTGPYARSRNPMYAGWALLHAGAGVAAGSGWTMAALPVAAALVHRQIRREENDLGADFGGAFERYRAAVPRYLGPRSFRRHR
jgi:protein-S-isoprenylcysteine O-methyltransferase Ste14